MKFLFISLVFFIACKIKETKAFNYPDCTSSDIEKMNTCLLGKRLRYAIEKLDLDTSRFVTIDEPPGILRGISIQDGDSSEILIYTPRKSIIDTIDKMNYQLYYTLILDSSIIGISWKNRYKNKKRNIGEVISYYEF